MSPRPDVSDERRSQIVEGATRVFARLGFNDARMEDIAQESGVSKGLLYWYFESKNDLILGIFDNLFDRELAELRALKGEDRSAKTRLLEFTNLVIADIKPLKPLMPVIFEFYALTLRNKTIQKAFKNFFRGYLEILTPIIQQGIDRGEFRPVNPQETAIAIGAVLEGTILLAAYDPGTIDLENHMASGVHLLIQGLQAG